MDKHRLSRASSSAEPFVRAATSEDLDQLTELSVGIQRLHARARPDLFREPDHEALRAFIESQLDSDAMLLVAESDCSVIGYLLAETVTRPASPFRHASSSMYVHQIAVSAGSQRQGAGSQLLRAAAAKARSEHLTTLRLDSWAFNGDAHAFFEAEGFEPMNIVFERPAD